MTLAISSDERGSEIRFKLTSKVIKIMPRPLQRFLKRLGFQRILELFINKSEGELIFQSNWVGKFKDNKGRVLKNKGHLVLTVHVFDNPFKRDPSHPHAFTKEDVLFLIKGAFMVILEKISSSEGMYAYVAGGPRSDKEELVLILKKRYD